MDFRKMTAIIALVLVAMLMMFAVAEGSISTTVSMRVSKLTQDAVVNVGEDLSIEISVDGVEPAAYCWYYEDQAIDGADQPVYNLVSAKLTDAGIYRMDAFDENGALLVSMDVNVRVTEPVVPKAGDASQPVVAACAGLAALAGFAVLSVRRRRG